MSNTITEGRDRELPPDRHGEIRRAPTPAAIELKTEVMQASAHKEAGQGDAMRERSSIESRTDLRLAATNEAVQADPARSNATLAIEQGWARRWADLDASDFGRIRSDSRREAALEAIADHMSTRQRRRLSVAQWRDLLGRFEPGTQTVAAFCAREGVCAASFHRWRTRLAGQTAGASRGGRKAPATTPVPHRAAGFVDIGPLTPAPPPDPTP